MSSQFGNSFRICTFGESHGPCVGCVIDGCPAGLELSVSDVQPQLDRRRPGQSSLTTARDEADRVEILSGVEGGVTLGTPVTLKVANRDVRAADYAPMQETPRPSHADYTYRARYGVTASSGGGRASARETVARVAAGAVAEKVLRERHGVGIVAWVSAVAEVAAPDLTGTPPTREEVDATAVRCPDAETAAAMTSAINAAAEDADSVGGIITCVCTGAPPGWGEPVFDKVESALAAAMLSIPAVKGFEIGSGFGGTRLRGSSHNDAFVMKTAPDGTPRLGTVTNRSGGVQGGITNGEPIVFRVAFKPTATIGRSQETVDYSGNPVVLETKGRHDPCVLPRAVPIVEAMASLVLVDMALVASR